MANLANLGVELSVVVELTDPVSVVKWNIQRLQSHVTQSGMEQLSVILPTFSTNYAVSFKIEELFVHRPSYLTRTLPGASPKVLAFYQFCLLTKRHENMQPICF